MGDPLPGLIFLLLAIAYHNSLLKHTAFGRHVFVAVGFSTQSRVHIRN